MKRLIKFMFPCLTVLFLVSCSTPTENQRGETSNESQSEETSNNSIWVEVEVDTEATTARGCGGIDRFFIDSRVTQPLADLVTNNKIRLELVGQKHSNDSQHYFGTESNKIETLNIYRVYVNKDLVTEITMGELSYVNGFTTSFSFRITKNGNSWKMKTWWIGGGIDLTAISILNDYYN